MNACTHRWLLSGDQEGYNSYNVGDYVRVMVKENACPEHGSPVCDQGGNSTGWSELGFTKNAV